MKCEVISINKSKFAKLNKKYFISKPYKNISKIIVVTYLLFALVYIFRDNLYNINNQYITLFAGVAPNLMGSVLFTLISVFYILPFFKGLDSINKSKFIWLINIVNIIFFLLIEYIHLVLELGSWDNNDIIASLIGIILSKAVYFKVRKSFLEI